MMRRRGKRLGRLGLVARGRWLRRVRRFAAAGAVFWALCGSAGNAQSKGVAASQQTAAATGGVLAGKAIFDRQCGICHYAASAAQKIGPGLKGLYARGQLPKGKRADDLGVTRWIANGGKKMPGFKDVLKPGQIRDLIAYLKTL